MTSSRAQRIFVSHFSSDFCVVKPANTIKAGTSHTVKTEESTSSTSSTDNNSSVSSFNYDDGKKHVQFADEDGEELCRTFVIENITDCEGLWWDENELRAIKVECTQIAKKYRNDEDFSNAVVGILMYGVAGNESKPDTKAFMDQMRLHEDIRGLEPHIVKQSEQLAELHNAAVFEAQEQAYERGLLGTQKGDWLICSASAQTSRPFEVLASRLAKFDTREAMRAAFSRWDSESVINKGKNFSSRRNSMSRKSASVRCVYS